MTLRTFFSKDFAKNFSSTPYSDGKLRQTAGTKSCSLLLANVLPKFVGRPQNTTGSVVETCLSMPVDAVSQDHSFEGTVEWDASTVDVISNGIIKDIILVLSYALQLFVIYIEIKSVITSKDTFQNRFRHSLSPFFFPRHYHLLLRRL